MPGSTICRRSPTYHQEEAEDGLQTIGFRGIAHRHGWGHWTPRVSSVWWADAPLLDSWLVARWWEVASATALTSRMMTFSYRCFICKSTARSKSCWPPISMWNTKTWTRRSMPSPIGSWSWRNASLSVQAFTRSTRRTTTTNPRLPSDARPGWYRVETRATVPRLSLNGPVTVPHRRARCALAVVIEPMHPAYMFARACC